jgi:integrase/recombinase XerC/integrase/recombinase XerD
LSHSQVAENKVILRAWLIANRWIISRPRSFGRLYVARVALLRPQRTTLGAAVEAFFSERDLAAATRRTYGATYRALLVAFGAASPVSSLTEARLRRWLTERWGSASPATWNARLTAVRVLVSYSMRQGWLLRDPTATLEQRRTPRDDTRSIPFNELEAMWSRSAISLREKLFWRMLYATAARASEVLSLDIEDLDLGRKRAAITGKGGHREVIVWDAATARLLPRYLAGKKGPLFVTSGSPNVEPAEVDRSPDGRGRLSYQRAWLLFSEASAGRWTLHQLRHSALTHLGEDGVAAPLLMAKSRHRDLRTLSRYVRPGVEAVARLTAEHDPARRTHRSRA